MVYGVWCMVYGGVGFSSIPVALLIRVKCSVFVALKICLMGAACSMVMPSPTSKRRMHSAAHDGSSVHEQ